MGELRQFRLHLLCHGLAEYAKLALARRTADVGKAEKVKRFRLATSAFGAVRGGKASEGDEAGLFFVEFQVELLQPLSKRTLEPPGVVFVLETHHEVVGVAHDVDFTARMPSAPLVYPLVKRVVQVDIGDQG